MLAVVILVAACATPPSSEPVTSFAPSPSPVTVATQSPVGTSQASGPLGASDDGLSLSVVVAAAEVEPGGRLTVAVTIHNGRSVPVAVQVQRCAAPVLMGALLRYPLDPTGRVWNGIAGEFKTYALAQAEHGAEITPNTFYADAKPCQDPASLTLTLQPGMSTNASLIWTAALVDGVPALPGDVPFTVSLGHDPTCSPPPGMLCPPLGSPGGTFGVWHWTYQQLTVAGTFRITGDAPKVVAAGQAVDALLGDRRFVSWLSKQPKETWSIANVDLLNQGPAQGIVPAGPSWDVELIRENGVPRNLAIGFVDPFTAKLRSLTFE